MRGSSERLLPGAFQTQIQGATLPRDQLAFRYTQGAKVESRCAHGGKLVSKFTHSVNTGAQEWSTSIKVCPQQSSGIQVCSQRSAGIQGHQVKISFSKREETVWNSALYLSKIPPHLEAGGTLAQMTSLCLRSAVVLTCWASSVCHEMRLLGLIHQEFSKAPLHNKADTVSIQMLRRNVPQRKCSSPEELATFYSNLFVKFHCALFIYL